MTEGGIQGFSSSGVSGCTENECIFYVEDGTDDAGPVIPYPPVGSCYYSTSANEIYMGEYPDGQPIISGFRFPNVSVPEGARIAYAYLEFTVDGPYSNNILVNILGEASSDPQPFGPSPDKPAERDPTAASVSWEITSTDTWQLSQTRRTPDITSILLEIIDQHGWQDGNSMALILQSVALGEGSDPDPAKRHRRAVGIERPQETYDGDVARLVIVLAYPPPFSISRYWNVFTWYEGEIQLEWNRLSNAGCLAATEHQGEDIVVILDFGSPERSYGELGTNLPGTKMFTSIEKIKRAVQAYVNGYWSCSIKDWDNYLTLGVGTNNQGLAAFYDGPAADHGTAWGTMIEDLHDWLINEQCTIDEFYVACNYRRQVTIVGANDIEDWGKILNFSTNEYEQVKPEAARAWALAYSESAPTKPYINYGNCSNCGAACPDPDPYPDNPWCRDHYWYLAWGNKNAWPLPEIYTEGSENHPNGKNAEQWQELSKYSSTFHTQIFFLGSLTQWGACERRVCEPGIANEPKDGWEQLFDELFKDPDTRQIVLPWSTDILWESDLLKEE